MYKYIKLSQLLASVKSDLSLYDDSGFIDEDRVIKTIAECNGKLGHKIYKNRECLIEVKNFKAPIPVDLYKVNNLFAYKILSKEYANPDFGNHQVEFVNKKPEDTSKIITYGKIACEDSCQNCYWVTDNKTKAIEKEIITQTLIPLNFSENLHINEDQFRFDFEKGQIYLDYLGDLYSDDGEIEIPFHPLLNPYYEYTIKEKILEDMYLNSEADIIQKLQYISQKKISAFTNAWNFVQQAKTKEWSNIQKKLRQEFWNKYYKNI